MSEANHTPHGNCFACDRPLNKTYVAVCWDQQTVWVGPDCWQHVADAGLQGWQPPKGGPRLWLPVYKAAPVLLAALEAARKELSHEAPGDCYSRGPGSGDPIQDYIACPGCAVLATMNAAIAKATGAP